MVNSYGSPSVRKYKSVYISLQREYFVSVPMPCIASDFFREINMGESSLYEKVNVEQLHGIQFININCSASPLLVFGSGWTPVALRKAEYTIILVPFLPW